MSDNDQAAGTSRLVRLLCKGLMLLVALSIVAALQLPIVRTRDAALRVQAMSNLRNVGMALQNYATNNKGFLPRHQGFALFSDVPQSWRIAVLPYLDQKGLFEKWNQREPWDSATNKELASTRIEVLQSLNDSRPFQFTNVVVVTGPQTCFPDDQAANLAFIPDGASQTILVIQYPYKDIHWAQPKDLTLDEAVELYSRPTLPFDYVKKSFWGGTTEADFVNVVFADGSGRVMPLGLPKETLRALFTASGGEKLKGDEFWLQASNLNPHPRLSAESASSVAHLPEPKYPSASSRE